MARWRYASVVACCLCILSPGSRAAMQFLGEPPAPQGREPVSTSAIQEASARTAPAEQVSLQLSAPPSIARLEDGKLWITATDADLSELLKQIAAIGSMQVDGAAPAGRVFGTYGPGYPKQVLTELLIGFACNFVMTGTTQDGLPQALRLSSRAEADSAAGTVALTAEEWASSAGEQDRILPGSNTDLADPGNADSGALGPGAVAHVPPGDSPEGTDPRNAALRAQQNLDRLRKIEEQGREHP